MKSFIHFSSSEIPIPIAIDRQVLFQEVLSEVRLAGQEIGKVVQESLSRFLPVTHNPADASADIIQVTDKKNPKKRRGKRTNSSAAKVKSIYIKVILDYFLTGTVELIDFLTYEYADILYDNLIALPFENMHRSRSAIWFGPVDYAYSSVNLNTKGCLESNPDLKNLARRLYKKLNCSFNSCLINLYKNEHENCGWHADDEEIFGGNPTIASISLGCTRRFQIQPFPLSDHRSYRQNLFSKSCSTRHEFELIHGELLVMRGDMQKYWQHSVPKESFRCGARLNLTFRNVVQ